MAKDLTVVVSLGIRSERISVVSYITTSYDSCLGAGGGSSADVSNTVLHFCVGFFICMHKYAELLVRGKVKTVLEKNASVWKRLISNAKFI